MSDESEKFAYKVLAQVLAMCFLTLIFYFVWFNVIHDQELSADSRDWAAFGDFMSGTLNPLLGFATLIWLIRAVNLQKAELENTVEALTESAKAQTKSVAMQLTHAKINTLLAQVAAVQSDIDAVRATISHYASESNYIGIEGEKLSAQHRRDIIDACNEELETNLRHRLELISRMSLLTDPEDKSAADMIQEGPKVQKRMQTLA